MSITTVNEATDELYRRVRDVDGTAHASVMLSVLSDCQRIVNAAYGGVVTTVTFTRTFEQTLYPYSDFASDVIRCLSVTYSGNVLHRLNWRELANINPQWLRATADTPLAWDMIGHNLLLIYPSPTQVSAKDVSIRYIPELADLAAGGTLAIPQAHVTLMLDLAEEVLLWRHRTMVSIEGAAAAVERHSHGRLVEAP